MFKNNIKKMSIDLGNHANDDDAALRQKCELYHEYECMDMAKTHVAKFNSFKEN